jgi:hypothetical protein
MVVLGNHPQLARALARITKFVPVHAMYPQANAPGSQYCAGVKYVVIGKVIKH